MMVFIARRERVIAIAIFGLSELVNSNLEEKLVLTNDDFCLTWKFICLPKRNEKQEKRVD